MSGSCSVPLGGFAQVIGDQIRLRGFVAMPDGSKLIEEEVSLRYAESAPEEIGQIVAERLAKRGAREILASLERLA